MIQRVRPTIYETFNGIRSYPEGTNVRVKNEYNSDPTFSSTHFFAHFNMVLHNDIWNFEISNNNLLQKANTSLHLVLLSNIWNKLQHTKL